MQNVMVVVRPTVFQKTEELFNVLLEKGYFADPINAQAYRQRLIDFVKTIPIQKHRPTKNKRWGQYFARYKPNRRTGWYITFDKEENEAGGLYIIRNIFNNHVKGYAHFIAGSK